MDCDALRFTINCHSLKRIKTFLKSRRVWGLLATGVVFYTIVSLLGRIDVTGIVPDTEKIARNIMEIWPRMPFFAQKETTANGQTEIRYTIPTKQLTPQDLKLMGMTNSTTHPSPPKK